MREILFKAKRIDNGEWIEGYYTERNGKTFIGIDISIYSDMFEVFCTPVIRWFEVNQETLCQFTGLCDKNENKIWENDIIKYHFGEIYAPIKYGCYQNCFDSQKAEHIGFYVDWPDDKCLRKDLGYWIDMVYAIPVGNIFDNPELLQEESTERFNSDGKKAIAIHDGSDFPDVCFEGEREYDVMNALAEYEDLEEQDLLVRLPCKVGDTVWVVTSPINVFGYDEYDGDAEYEVYESFLSSVSYYASGEQFRIYAKVTNSFIVAYFRECDFGESIFLTREDAEKKLEEMKK